MTHTVKIYSTPTCVYCRLAKEFFKENGIKYEEVDVSADQEAAQEMIDKTGQMGVPVIEIDGKLVVGFDKNHVKKMLGMK